MLRTYSEYNKIIVVSRLFLKRFRKSVGESRKTFQTKHILRRRANPRHCAGMQKSEHFYNSKKKNTHTQSNNTTVV